MSKIKPSVFQISNFKGNRDPKPDFYIKTLPQHRKEHPFVTTPHAHDFYLLMVFTNGSGTHTIDFNTYPVKKGSVFFMTPSEVHSWNLSDDTDGFILFFNTTFYLIDTIPKQLFELPFFKLKDKVRHGLLDPKSLKEVEIIAKAIVMENERESAFQKNILRAYLDVMLYKLSALLKTNSIDKTIPASLIPELQLLIEHYFMQHQPVAFYSDKLSVSTQQLNTITKNYLHKTVTELIQERIIAEAKRLLVYSTLTVSEIAYQLNFSDNSYFNRFFKKAESVTPEQFRKRFL
ncbi:MAG: hypothetical protein JWP12_987 [Bacteroidetes bacterium]|nr:hypothetical protein [Bacteroidota bacterium]